jgi:hypothetical protein
MRILCGLALTVVVLSCQDSQLTDNDAVPVLAGNAHFVGTPTATRSGNSLTVSGKVAGLGNIPDIFVEISAQAACLNRGENFPQAANKQSFSADGRFPVQTGKADFILTLTATFQPKCSPPMRIVFGPVTVNVYDDDPAEGGTLLLTKTINGPGPGGTFPP